MTREEAIARVKHQRDWANEVNRMLDVEAFEMAAKALEDFEALNAINLDLADENEDLVERIGKLVGFIDYLRNTAQGKKKSLNLLEKVVKGQLKEIRAEEPFINKPCVSEGVCKVDATKMLEHIDEEVRSLVEPDRDGMDNNGSYNEALVDVLEILNSHARRVTHDT